MKIWMKRWKWYLISGASILVALLIFAVIVYINMTPTLGKDANIADKIFDFLDKWASAGGPAIMLIAIAVALGIGLAGILQTRNMQRNEQKRRLLSEIIEWALDIARCGVERDIEALWDTRDREYSVLDQMTNTFRGLLRRSRYISKIILPSWHSLRDPVEEMRGELEVQIEYLTKYAKDPTESKFKTVENHRGTVNRLASKIIDEACQILTRVIDSY